MSKKNKTIIDKTEEDILDDSVTQPTSETTSKIAEKKSDENKKSNKKNQNSKKKKKDKNKGSITQSARGTISELKKVTWPTFAEVVKRTGVVLAFVIIFGVIIFGIDSLLGLIVKLLQG